VFHLGVCWEVAVAAPYDGAEDALVNMGPWLFTYEFLQSFLDQLQSTNTTFRTYMRAAIRSYVMATHGGSGSDRVLHRRLMELLEQLSLDGRRSSPSKKMYQAFINAVMDYITLQVFVTAACQTLKRTGWTHLTLNGPLTVCGLRN
jgi:hypothetical protein